MIRSEVGTDVATHAPHVHAQGSVADVVDGGQLLSIVERIETVEGQIKELNADKSEIYKEARGNGFVVKALRAIVKYRAEDRNKRAEFETIFDLYLRSIGEG